MSKVSVPQGETESLDRLHLGWWVVVLGGTAVLALLAFSTGAYAVWCQWVSPVLTQTHLRALLMIAVAGHIAEAVYAVWLAQRAGLQNQAAVLFVRTLAVGFPSLRLLRRQLERMSLLVVTGVILLAGTSSAQMNHSYRQQNRGIQVPTDELAKQLSSPDPSKRLQAVKALGSSKDSKAIEYLIKALADSDVRVQAKAVQMLGDMRATESTQILLQRLVLRTSDANMKQLIIVSLGKIGDPSAVRPLIELLQQDLDAATRGTAIFALGELGAPEALDVLDRIAQTDSDPTLRRVASEAKSKVESRHDTLPRASGTK